VRQRERIDERRDHVRGVVADLESIELALAERDARAADPRCARARRIVGVAIDRDHARELGDIQIIVAAERSKHRARDAGIREREAVECGRTDEPLVVLQEWDRVGDTTGAT
jgi:hypothetical protein